MFLFPLPVSFRPQDYFKCVNAKGEDFAPCKQVSWLVSAGRSAGWRSIAENLAADVFLPVRSCAVCVA